MSGMIIFFGDPWDSPALDESVRIQIPTPVGMPCFWCGESIQDGDRGFMRACLTLDADETTVIDSRPLQVECDLRMVLGSIAHLENRCRCDHPGMVEEDYPGTMREEAREVLRRVNQQRALQGIGPLWEQP